jgi:hypothetical protein
MCLSSFQVHSRLEEAEEWRDKRESIGNRTKIWQPDGLALYQQMDHFQSIIQGGGKVFYLGKKPFIYSKW